MNAAGASGRSPPKSTSKDDLKILALIVIVFYGLLGTLNAWRRIIQWQRSRKVTKEMIVSLDRPINRKRSGINVLYRQHIALPALAGTTHMGTTSVFGLPPVSLPTRLEAICISFYIFLNILLGIIQYDYSSPSSLMEAANRQGIFALLNILLLALHAGRNSPIILITGLPFSAVLLVHRWIGRLVVAQIAAHGLMIMYQSASTGGAATVRKYISVPYVAWGVASMAIGFVILVQAWGPFRRAFYESFHFLHLILAIFFFVGAWMHRAAYRDQKDLRSLLSCAVTVFIIECAFRIFSVVAINVPVGKLYGEKKQFSYARLQAVAGATRVKISVPRLPHISPGQYVYLHVPALGLFQAHPFTVAWVEGTSARDFGAQRTIGFTQFDKDEDENATIQLIVKAHDGFTRTLLTKAQDSPNCEIKCMIEGPYGSTSRSNVDAFDEVTLICGGIGITYALLVLKHHLVQQYARKINQRMSLIWIVRYDAEIAWAQSHLDYLIEHSTGSLKLAIHVTRPSMRSKQESKSSPGTLIDRTTFIVPMKPNLSELIKLAILDRTGTLAILSCGPGGFSDEIRKSMVKEMEDGVTYIEEAFAW